MPMEDEESFRDKRPVEGEDSSQGEDPSQGEASLLREVPDRDRLAGEYNRLYPILDRVLQGMEDLIEQHARHRHLTVTLKGRVKTFESAYAKILKRRIIPADLYQLTDLLGLRIVCPFLEDQGKVEALLEENFTILERESKGDSLSYREFGYDSIHYLIALPDFLEIPLGREGQRPAAEVQIRTILQDAWAEVEHELIYKAEFTPYDDPLKRKLAALNANLSLSDIMFQEIRDYQRQLHQQLTTRRELFFRKVKRQTAELLLPEDEPESSQGGQGEGGRSRGERGKGETEGLPPRGETIDEMLLQGLYAHNRGDYQETLRIYTALLERNPPRDVLAVILLHRGMAYFSLGDYPKALEDFEQGIGLEPKNEKPYYYRGIIKLTTGELEQAVADFSASLRLNPYQFSPLFSRAQAVFRQGQTARALEDCDAALKIKPDSRQANRFRLRIMKQLEEG